MWRPLLRLTLDRPIHMRFIEYMPIGDEHTSSHCAVDRMRRAQSRAVGRERYRAERRAAGAHQCRGPPRRDWASSSPLDINDAPAGAGPARYWHFPGAAGTVGFITPCPIIFVQYCNRSASDGRWNVRSVPVQRCRVFRVRDALRRG